MDKVASFGLTTYWDLKKGEARNVMQDELKQKYPLTFYVLTDIPKNMFLNYGFILCLVVVPDLTFSHKFYPIFLWYIRPNIHHFLIFQPLLTL